MSFASNDGLDLQSLSFATLAELSAVETSDLVEGDIAYVNSEYTEVLSFHAWFSLQKSDTTAVGANTVYSKNAAGNPANPGRWRRLSI